MSEYIVSTGELERLEKMPDETGVNIPSEKVLVLSLDRDHNVMVQLSRTTALELYSLVEEFLLEEDND